MAEALTAPATLEFLRLTVEKLGDERARLDSLDAAIGDGDHGTSLAMLFARAFRAVQGSDHQANNSPGQVLQDFGRILLETGTGASGTLYATLFLALGAALGDRRTATLDCLAYAAAKALDAVADRGGTKPGEATMVDAIAPFTSALAESSSDSLDFATAVAGAADAAQDGALATVQMVAARGRARGFGLGSAGKQDPGAASFAIIARALAEAVA